MTSHRQDEKRPEVHHPEFLKLAGELRFEGEPVPPIKVMDTDCRVVYTGSFSMPNNGVRLNFTLPSEEQIVKDIEILGKLTYQTLGA